MTINRGSIAYLLIVWAFAILIGLTFSLNIPLVLLIIGTILYLIP